MAASMHALIYPSAPSVLVERRRIELVLVPPHKAAWWRPVVVVGDASFDPLTHRKTGPVTTIETERVVDTYSVVALTAQEISDRKDAAIDGMNGGLSLLLKALLSVHNRVRVLEGQSTHTMAQFKAGLKALL